MVIHIKLSDRKTADRDDPLGRAWYGFDHEAKPAELWENNRGDWRLKAEKIVAERGQHSTTEAGSFWSRNLRIRDTRSFPA